MLTTGLETIMLIASGLLLTDFTPETDMGWAVVNDGVMGGKSEGRARVVDGQLRFEGVLRTDGGGFSFVRSDDKTFKLGGYAGVMIRAQGDARAYTLRLTSTAGAALPFEPAYQATFTPSAALSDRFVAFDALKVSWRGRRLSGPAFDPDGVTSVAFMMADGRDGPFALGVDRITAVPWAQVDDLSNARPLVIFAPTIDDARLAKQRAGVTAERVGFDARDMRLMLITADGQSRLGGLPIRPTDVKTIRARHGVAADGFAVHLVGKDGGIKRRASSVMALQGIFEQIDRMPMRAAEIEAARQR